MMEKGTGGRLVPPITWSERDVHGSTPERLDPRRLSFTQVLNVVDYAWHNLMPHPGSNTTKFRVLIYRHTFPAVNIALIHAPMATGTAQKAEN